MCELIFGEYVRSLCTICTYRGISLAKGRNLMRKATQVRYKSKIYFFLWEISWLNHPTGPRSMLWICCGFAVNLLWICCGCAVTMLWQCCDYAVNIISCAIDVIMMYDSYRLPTRPPNADGHYYYSIDAPSSYTVTHLDASPSTVVGAREKERARRAIAVVMIVIVGCRRWYIDINRIITWERLDMLGRKGREINRKGREREWMQQSKH